MVVLIPIISKKESNHAFLEKAIEGEKEAFLLATMDTGATAKNFGFATSELGHGNDLMGEIKEFLEEKKIVVDDVLEWGDTNKQIINFARLKKIKKVFLIKQENKYFNDLVKELKQNKIKVEVF